MKKPDKLILPTPPKVERKPIVVVESPYAAKGKEELERNVHYARAAVRDCLLRGEAPVASHLLYTQEGILLDNVPEERAMGIQAGLALLSVADLHVVYTDLGISPGMKIGIAIAKKKGVKTEYRTIPGYEN